MTEKKQLEMERLKSFGETILSYAYESGDISSNIFEMFNEGIRVSFERNSLVQMRIAVNDVKWIVEDTLSLSHLKALDNILMEKFGEDISSKKFKAMTAILTRGKIRNDEEFVRVNEWIDHLLYDKDNPDAEQQIEQYNQLLRDYEERAARRLNKSNPRS